MRQDQPAEFRAVVADIRRAWRPDQSPITGLSWDDDGRRLIVDRIPGDAGFDRDVPSKASPAVAVLLVDVDTTLHEETRVITDGMPCRDRTDWPGRRTVHSVSAQSRSNGPAKWNTPVWPSYRVRVRTWKLSPQEASGATTPIDRPGTKPKRR